MSRDTLDAESGCHASIKAASRIRFPERRGEVPVGISALVVCLPNLRQLAVSVDLAGELWKVDGGTALEV
jgi:hypothetical protein